MDDELFLGHIKTIFEIKTFRQLIFHNDIKEKGNTVQSQIYFSRNIHYHKKKMHKRI